MIPKLALDENLILEPEKVLMGADIPREDHTDFLIDSRENKVIPDVANVLLDYLKAEHSGVSTVDYIYKNGIETVEGQFGGAFTYKKGSIDMTVQALRDLMLYHAQHGHYVSQVKMSSVALGDESLSNDEIPMSVPTSLYFKIKDNIYRVSHINNGARILGGYGLHRAKIKKWGWPIVKKLVPDSKIPSLRKKVREFKDWILEAEKKPFYVTVEKYAVKPTD
ncbi:hypothetical protein ISS09_04705 [Candidatus Woesearchaeota archaeon]|nr:hypothetical protein [Candidatus Woesearchaeota archaeon]